MRLEDQSQILAGPLKGNVLGLQAGGSSDELSADEGPFMKVPQEARIPIRSTPATSKDHLQPSLADRTLGRVEGTTHKAGGMEGALRVTRCM